MLMSERAGLATKTLSHEAAQRKTLWSFVSWCLSGEILLNTLLPTTLLRGGATIQRLLEIADQDNVARLRAAREGESLAVGREVEREDEIRHEIGQLFGRAAVNGLRPEV